MRLATGSSFLIDEAIIGRPVCVDLPLFVSSMNCFKTEAFITGFFGGGVFPSNALFWLYLFSSLELLRLMFRCSSMIVDFAVESFKESSTLPSSLQVGRALFFLPKILDFSTGRVFDKKCCYSKDTSLFSTVNAAGLSERS